jgi:apolipoprotein N-acyltransferase
VRFTCDGWSFATTVCYENAYAGYHARAARLGVDFLVNLSNEGWFGASSEFDQMDAVSRLRAIETRRSLVRVTNSGISAVYDAAGRRRATLLGEGGRDRAVAGFLLAEVPIAAATAPFVRTGEAFGFAVTLAATLWLLASAIVLRRRYRARRPS